MELEEMKKVILKKMGKNVKKGVKKALCRHSMRSRTETYV